MDKVWVLAVDWQRARVFECEHPRAGLRELGELARTVRRKEADEHAAQRFVAAVCQALEHACGAGRFGRLYVVAEPPLIHRLQRGMAVCVRRCLAGELGLDPSGRAGPELRARLPEVL